MVGTFMPMRNEVNNPSSRTVRRAAGVVMLMLLFTCVCSIGFVNLSRMSVGIETRDMDLSLKYLINGRRSQVRPSPFLLDLTGTASASAYNRGCDGWSFPLGSAELTLMGCTTVVTP